MPVRPAGGGAVLTVPALFERDAELDQLQRAWRVARAGRGSSWLLCAEAGGGKTRLATEAARATGARTLWGAAEPLSPPEPYLAITRALPGFQPGPSRAASVTAALACLDQIAGEEPLLLVLDDLQFADDGTIATVVRLATECRARPWLVIAALRPGEGMPGLLDPLIEIAAQGTARRLDPRPLTEAGVAALAAAVSGGAVGPAEAAELHRDSGGNPWFAETLARGDQAISAVHARLNLRLDQLERVLPGAVLVLEALAPATHPLPYELVARLCGGDSRELRRMLRALRDSSMLRETADGGWQFSHELMRRAVLDGMLAGGRRAAHLALAEAVETTVRPSATDRVPVAELAMHYAAAGDARAVAWGLRAAEQARAVDAHGEALAQYQRVLGFELPPEQQRATLESAAEEAWALGRYDHNRALCDAAIAIAGATPETYARLHMLAGRAAYRQGDFAADQAHLTAAERLLAGRALTLQQIDVSLGRVARAALAIDPVRLEAAAELTVRQIEALGLPAETRTSAALVTRYRAVSRIESGDPAGFARVEEVVRTVEEHRLAPGTAVAALGGAYSEAVVALFHDQAAALHDRLVAAIARHEFGWGALVEPYRMLELVQRGAYQQAGAYARAMNAPSTGTLEAAVAGCALVMWETRAGSLDRARAALAAVMPPADFQQRAMRDLARLEVALVTNDPELGELAQQMYAAAILRQDVRAAGMAAVGLAVSGRGAPPLPAWLVEAAPARALWQWADGIARQDASLLREVAGRLERLHCPYEAALASRDAGDLDHAYRSLRALGATTARQQTAEMMRAASRRIPRRTRAQTAAGGLTETETSVCRRVATGETNEQIAAALVISARTVETHLTRIYQKTGCRGRAALATWWAALPSLPD